MFNFKSSFPENKSLFQRLYFWMSLPPLIIALLLTLVTIFLLKFLPSRLPLFYSLPWGDGQLATPKQFLLIPSFIGLITLINLIISWQLHSSQFFFKRILLLSSLIVNLILTITFIKIVLIFI